MHKQQLPECSRVNIRRVFMPFNFIQVLDIFYPTPLSLFFPLISSHVHVHVRYFQIHFACTRLDHWQQVIFEEL